ncbi:MAG: helix-turn-helix domain-containing protein [Streptosporangiaceae bacterium]
MSMAVPLSAIAFRTDGASKLRSSTYLELPWPGAGPVDCIWTGRPGWSPRSLLLLPDGCVDIVWDGNAITVVRPRATAVRHTLTNRKFAAGIRLRPGWAAHTLRTPIASLPPLADMADIRSATEVSRFAEMLADEAEPMDSAHLLARWAEKIRPAGSLPDARLLHAIDLLSQPSSVGSAALQAGYSARELRRRFAEHVGLSPKRFQRVTRFQRFRSLMAGPASPPAMAQAAAFCGYYDQAHLAHDCRVLACRTPTALARVTVAGHQSAMPIAAERGSLSSGAPDARASRR